MAALWRWPSLEVIYTENAFGTPNGDRWVEVAVQSGDRPRQVILYKQRFVDKKLFPYGNIW